MGNFVFISYSRTDRDYAQQLASFLQSETGIPMWYDYELASGDRFDKVIQDRIDECGAFVLVLSPAAKASEWVAGELSYARSHGRPVLPLMLRWTELPVNIHHLHVENVTDHSMPSKAFVRHLSAIVHAQPVPAPPFFDEPAYVLPARPQRAPGQRRSFGLTARELRIAALVARGRDERAIAEMLSLPEGTVVAHVQAVFAKTGTQDRSALKHALRDTIGYRS